MNVLFRVDGDVEEEHLEKHSLSAKISCKERERGEALTKRPMNPTSNPTTNIKKGTSLKAEASKSLRFP